MEKDNNKLNSKLQEIHLKALKEFDKVQTSQRDERLQCLQDRRFYSVAGAQWEGPLGIQFENKPRFEVNKIHLSVIRIINQYRNNRIDAEFRTRDGSTNKFTEDFSDIYRGIEQESNAEEAYDNAFEEAVGGGIGAWRIRTAYEDDEDEENEFQKICIEPIYDADSSVFFDLGAKKQDKSDAMRCWVLDALPRDEYKERFNREPTSIGKQIFQVMFDWLTPDVVYIAEYYEVESFSENIYVFQGLDGTERKVKQSELDNEEGLEEELIATGFNLIRKRKIKRPRVHKYLMDGGQILEDCGYISGKNIPIVVTYGKRWYVDNVERMMGHVRLSKDPQRLKNMQLSKLGEYAAVSVLEKPIFTPKQIAGHQIMWADDNLVNHPYLLVNELTDPVTGQIVAIGPQAYRKPPDLPPAMGALLQLTEQDMQDLLGNQQATEQIKSNISGKALDIVQQNLDMQSYIYISNFGKAIKRSAQIVLGMTKDTWNTPGQTVKGLDAQGQARQITLIRPIFDNNGAIKYENDPSQANFDVNVIIGPSTPNKKQATINTLLEMMTIAKDPDTLQVLSSMLLMNMQGDGISDIQEYFRKKLVKIGALKPTAEDQEEMAAAAQNAQPDAQTEFIQASTQQALAQAEKAKTDSGLTIAKIEETMARTKEISAKTMETLANIAI